MAKRNTPSERHLTFAEFMAKMTDPHRRYTPEEGMIHRVEPSWGRAALFFRTGHRIGPFQSVRMRSALSVHRHLEVLRKRAATGRASAIMAAIEVCAEENLPLPDWCALAFLERMQRFYAGEFLTLDSAFPGPFVGNTDKQRAAARRDWELAVTLWCDAHDLANTDPSIKSENSLIDRLLQHRNYGIAKTRARELIRMVDESRKDFSRDQGFSRFFNKRRKD